MAINKSIYNVLNLFASLNSPRYNAIESKFRVSIRIHCGETFKMRYYGVLSDDTLNNNSGYQIKAGTRLELIRFPASCIEPTGYLRDSGKHFGM